MSSGSSDVQSLLKQIWLFAALEPSDLAQIATLARIRTCRAKEIVVQQGDSSGDLFSVVRGRLKVGTIAPDGKEVLLAVLGQGDVFGEIALLDQKPRSATVTAAETCRLLVVPAASFRALLLQLPHLSVRLLHGLAGHVRRLSVRMEDAATLDVRARLAKALLALGDRFGVAAPEGKGVRINLRLSQQELGRFVNATREMVNRCLVEWAERGIAVHRSGAITIRNPERLRAIAEGETKRQQPVPRRTDDRRTRSS